MKRTRTADLLPNRGVSFLSLMHGSSSLARLVRTGPGVHTTRLHAWLCTGRVRTALLLHAAVLRIARLYGTRGHPASLRGQLRVTHGRVLTALTLTRVCGRIPFKPGRPQWKVDTPMLVVPKPVDPVVGLKGSSSVL